MRLVGFTTRSFVVAVLAVLAVLGPLSDNRMTGTHGAPVFAQVTARLATHPAAPGTGPASGRSRQEGPRQQSTSRRRRVDPLVVIHGFADLGRWGLLPAHAGTTPRATSWLIMTIPSGYTVHTAALLANETSHPLTVRLFSADAHTGQNGAFLTTNLTQPLHGAGRWLWIEAPERVTVPPRSGLRIPLVMRVPPRTPVGLHAGALEALAPPVPMGMVNGVHLNIAEQIGLRLYVTVPGRAIARPHWSSLRCPVVDGHVSCAVTMTNDGTIPLTPHGTLVIHGVLNNQTVRLSLNGTGEVLPGDRIALEAVWSGAGVGLYTIMADVEAAGQHVRRDARIVAPPPFWIWIALALVAYLAWRLYRARPRLWFALSAAMSAWRLASVAPMDRGHDR